MKIYALAVGTVLLASVAVATDDIAALTAFAANCPIRPMISAGEAMSLYGRGYSDAASARETICAYRVFRTLADAGLPQSRKADETASALAEAIRCTTRLRASAPCFDFGFWGPLGRFGFDEPMPELLVWDKEVEGDLRFAAPEFFSSVPLKTYSAAEKAYAASCRYRGIPYRAPGADIREGGKVPLCNPRRTGLTWIDRGAFKSDYTFSEPCRMRRQLVVKPLGDGATAFVRERVQMLGDGDLYDGYDALPFDPKCVRVLAMKGLGLRQQDRLFVRYGETLYDVTYAVNVEGDAAALAAVSAAVPKLPVITEPGDETAYWQEKIDAMSAAGGGTVTVSPGEHKVCELEMKSNVTLEIPAGAVIVAVTNKAAYSWDLGVKAELQKTGVIVAFGATNIALVGKGEIDGRGEERPRGRAQSVGRWRNVFFYRCRGVRMEGLTLKRPNFWTIFLRECEQVRVKGLTIRSYANWNNDGIDLCVSDALIEDCDIISEDDGIVFKSFDPDRISHDVEVRNCRVSSNAGAIKFGTETFGIFRDYDIHDCEILSRHRGPKTLVGSKALPGVEDPRTGNCALSFLMVDGGILERIRVRDVAIGAAYASPLCFRLGHRHGRENWGRTAMRDILIERVNMTAPAESWCGSFACGVPESVIDGITIRDSHFIVKAAPESAVLSDRPLPNVDGRFPSPGIFGQPMPAHFLFCRHAENVALQNVKIDVVGGKDPRPPFKAEDRIPAVAVSAVERDVYLLIGQSNMADLDASFAVEMAKTSHGREIALVPCAVGGTPIGRWLPGADLYTNAVGRCRAALASGGTLKGILWHQGEADAANPQDIAAYGERLKTVVRSFRRDLNAPDVPFVAGELATDLRRLGGSGCDEVSAATRRVMEELPHCALVSSSGLTLEPDRVHFNTPSLRRLGVRYADALRTAAPESESDRYVAEVRKADCAADAAWDAARDRAQFLARRTALREKFLVAVGAFPERTPLNARIVATVPRSGYRIEKILFESRPGFHVPALVFVPDATRFAPPYPAVLVTCGHSVKGKANAGYQRACVMGACEGFLMMIYDPIDQGERIMSTDGPCCYGHNQFGAKAHAIGLSAAHFRIWDGMRSLDYLQSRPDVKADRLGLMGNSGGGTMTALIAATDPRVRAACPSCYITALRDVVQTIGPQDAEQCLWGQLKDGINHASLVLMAEGAVRLQFSDRDFFPIGGARSTYGVVRRTADRVGLGDRYSATIVRGPHGWKESSRRSSLDWMRQWLMDEAPNGKTDADYVALDATYDAKTADCGLPEDEAKVAPGGSVLNLPGERTVSDVLVDLAIGAKTPRLVFREKVPTRHSFYGAKSAAEENAVIALMLGKNLVEERAEEILAKARAVAARGEPKPVLVAEDDWTRPAECAYAEAPELFAGFCSLGDGSFRTSVRSLSK